MPKCLSFLLFVDGMRLLAMWLMVLANTLLSFLDGISY